LMMVSLAPFAFKLVGPIYLVGAVVLGILFVAAAIQFARRLDHSQARRLFFVSILYLPMLLGLMVFDKLKY